MFNAKKLLRGLSGKALKKALKRLKNRKIQLMMALARRAETENREIKRGEEARVKSLTRRSRPRERDKDGNIKRSSREEQLWKLKSVNMKEKIRGRKKEAMRRWTMTATSGGAYRGR